MDEAELQALIQALSGMGVLPEQRNQLDQQMKMAQNLRQTPMPEGRYVSGGRVFVASPYEAAASGLGRAMGQRQIQNVQGQQQALVPQEQAMRNTILSNILREMAKKQQPVQQAVPKTAPSPETVASGDWGWQAE